MHVSREENGRNEVRKRSKTLLQKRRALQPLLQIRGRIPNAKSVEEVAGRGRETLQRLGGLANRPGMAILGTVHHPGRVSAVLTTHPPFKARQGCGLN